MSRYGEIGELDAGVDVWHRRSSAAGATTSPGVALQDGRGSKERVWWKVALKGEGCWRRAICAKVL